MHTYFSYFSESCRFFTHESWYWHPVTCPDLCLFRWRLCSGGSGCRRSILLHHGRFICHTYLLNPFEWFWMGIQVKIAGRQAWCYMMLHDVTWCYMIPTVENKWNNHNYSECATQGNMDNCLSDSSISISAIAFSWSWTALMHKIVSWKGGSCTAHVNIPWHALTFASSGGGFAVEEGAVDGASCCIMENSFATPTFWMGIQVKIAGSYTWWCMMMHDDAWYCMISSVKKRANTPLRPHPFYAVHLGISNVRLYIQLGRSTMVLLWFIM